MGEVIYLPSATRQQPEPADYAGLTRSEVARLEAIRDNVEALLNMVAGIAAILKLWPMRRHASD